MSIDRITSVLGNGVGAMPPDRGPLGDKILESLARKLIRRGGGVGVLVEADDAFVRKVLDPDVFWTAQRQSNTLDGILLFGTRDRTRLKGARWLSGAPASRVNDPRPIVVGKVVVDGGEWELDLAGLHRPKPNGGAYAGGVMDKRLREADIDLALMDANLRRAALARRFPAYAVRSEEVMAQLVRRRTLHVSSLDHWDLVPGTKDDDHPGTALEVWPVSRR